jgi:hypothetical protein
MDLKIEQKDVAEFVSAALLTKLDQNARDELIKEALKTLISPPERNSYGQLQKSPLQEAFDQAVRRTTQTIAYDMIEENAEFKAKLKELITEAVEVLFTRKREDVTNKIADAIIKGMTEKEY